MTRDQAMARAEELNAEHPERHSARWIARDHGGVWEVARVSLPPTLRRDPMQTTAETRPRPPHAPDPRPLFDRNVGGPYAVG